MVMTAMVMTAGTNTPDTLSAILAMGALVAAASLTMLDDLGQGGILAYPGGLGSWRKPDWLTVAAETLSPGCLVHRDALAGQGSFIDGAGALQHDAVHRDALARAHDEDVALLHLLNGNRLLPRRPAARRRSWEPASSGS